MMMVWTDSASWEKPPPRHQVAQLGEDAGANPVPELYFPDFFALCRGSVVAFVSGLDHQLASSVSGKCRLKALHTRLNAR